MKHTALVLAAAIGFAAVGFSATPSTAADFVDQNVDGATQCLRVFRSPILDLPPDQIRTDVGGKYEHALEVSERKAVIYSQSQLFTWANEAKVSCAKAVGFMKSGEVNGEQISQCDCFYSRMRLLMRH